MRLALLILLLAPITAHAMPAAFWVAVGFAASTAATLATVSQFVFVIGMAIYGSAQQRKAARKQRDAYNASLQDRTVSSAATEAPHVYVYGRAKVGSAIVAMFTSGDRDQYKHLVCVHAAHECDAIEEIYVNGNALGTLDGNGNVTSGRYYQGETRRTSPVSGESHAIAPDGTFPLNHLYVGDLNVQGIYASPDGETATRVSRLPATVTGNVIDGYTVQLHAALPDAVKVWYNYFDPIPRVRAQIHLGTASDPADATLLAEVPSKWASTSVLRGFCYTVIRVDLNEPEFQDGPPRVEVLMRGAKLYDFRTGVTAWSQNNVLSTYRYLTSELCGVDSGDLPMAEWIAAANVCDEAQSFGARYTFNGTVTSDEDQKGVLERMAQSMAGGIVSTTWSIWAGKYVAPVMALEQSDIVGQIAITPGMSDADLYNGVRGQYISSETSYVATDFPPFQNSTYVTADGRELWTNIDFPYTDSATRVHNLSRIFTEDQRNGYTVKAEFSLKAWSVKVGQRVTLTSAFFGWSAKVFRVTDRKFSPGSAVELTLKEDAASIWDFADAVEVDSTPNSDLPNPFDIAALEYIDCETGTEALLLMQDGTIQSGIVVSWPEATSPNVYNGGQIEVEWSRDDDAAGWQKTSVAGDSTSVRLPAVKDGEYYEVRARTFYPPLNLRSDWVYKSIQIVGKTEAPSNITNLSIAGSVLSWTPVTDLDLSGYIFRFHYGSNLDWGTAVPLHDGVIVSSPFDLVTRPGGVVTIMAKALDTSGNESLASVNIVTDLGEAPIGNVVEEVDFKADSFPGTLEGCSIVGGNLVADDLDSAYGTDSQSFYGPDNDPFYDLSTYAQMVYTTNEVSVASALLGSLLTIEHVGQGTDLFIEYRLSGPSSFYGPDSDSAYGADGESFYGGPGSWVPWPGQIVAANDGYQFRVTLGAGPAQGQITTLKLIVDAPDIIEYIEDVAISSSGTAIPYTKPFNFISTVTATLQVNSSGAETIEIDKAINLSPVAKAYNSSHTAVSGATADIIIKGR